MLHKPDLIQPFTAGLSKFILISFQIFQRAPPPPLRRISGRIAFLRLAATMGELFDGGSALVQVFPV